MVPKEGLEPSHPCGYQILSLARLPFRHFGQVNSVKNRGDISSRQELFLLVRFKRTLHCESSDQRDLNFSRASSTNAL